MKKIILISVVFFTFCSCASDDAGFEQMTKKDIMNSWAWKIFIFTDEGEIAPVRNIKNDFENTLKDKSIFVEDIWQIYKSDDLFLNNKKGAFKDPIVNANFSETTLRNFSSYKNEKAPDNYRENNQVLITFSEENKAKK
jgi:hypothetical protein